MTWLTNVTNEFLTVTVPVADSTLLTADGEILAKFFFASVFK